MNDKTTVPYIETEGEIPLDALIQCPLTHFAHRRAASCAKCDKFRGLMVISLAEDKPWDHNHRIVCASPVARTVHLIAE